MKFFVSESINELVHITFEEKDYATHNFLQWYVSEQIEEEATAKNILDKINLNWRRQGRAVLVRP
jgi:ferritin